MNNISETVRQIDAIFHPRSVAIVGVPRGLKIGRLFLMALQDQKFPGRIYRDMLLRSFKNLPALAV